MRTLLYCFLGLSVLCSCGRQPESQTNDLHHVSVDTSAVIIKGTTITGAVFQTLSTNLQNALADSGVSGALKFCNVEAMPLTDSLSQNYGVTVRRASHRPRNSCNRVDSLEMASIKTYLEHIETSEELKPIVNASEYRIIYHAPIRIAGQLCMNCHGTPRTDITAGDMEIINKLYPEDEATGFSIGDLRGIWVIEFPELYFKNKAGIEDE